MGIIRFLLALSVVTGHIPFQTFHLFDGPLAVKAFFVISGFYMALILNEKYSSYRAFLLNRSLRIFPVYWAVLLITFIFVLFNHNFIAVEYWEFFKIPSLIFMILTNLLIFGQDVVLFMGIDIVHGSLYFTQNFWNVDFPLYKYLLIPQAWSISIELMFYLTAPLLVKRKPWLILSVILFSTLLRLIAASFGLSNDPWSYRFFPFELTYFCLGILSYKVYAHIKKSSGHAPTALILLLFIIVYIGGFHCIPHTFSSESTFLFPLLIAAATPFIFLYLKSNKWDRYIGDLSYPIYICHNLIINIIDTFLSPHLPNSWLGMTWVLTLIATVIFSMGLLKLISDPIDKYRHSKVA